MVLVSLIGVAGLQFTFTDRLDLLILGALTGTVMLYDRLIFVAFSGIRPPDQRRTAGDRPCRDPRWGTMVAADVGGAEGRRGEVVRGRGLSTGVWG